MPLAAAFLLLLLAAEATTAADPVWLPFSPHHWYRRDDNRCVAASDLNHTADTLAVASDSAAVLFWQIPLDSGAAHRVAGRPGWLRRCERPPAVFWQELAEHRPPLVDLRRFPQLTWSWQAFEEGVPDSASGALVTIGLVLQKGDSPTQTRELSYVWSRNEVVGSESRSSRTLVPGLLKMTTGRIVLRQGGADAAWQPQSRNIADDAARLLGGERPGRLLRLSVKVHGEPGRTAAHVRVAGLRMQQEPELR